MKNLKSVFVLSLFCALTFLSNSQLTLFPEKGVQYGKSENLHSRAIISFRKNLFIAASDGNLYQYNSKSEKIKQSNNWKGIEYRDIAINKKNIIILASGDSSATISKPRPIGKERYRAFNGQFLDGIALHNETLFMMGDPIDGKFNLFSSTDFGWNWKKVENAPIASDGEAGFAASGTNVGMISEKEWLFVSGGIESKLYQTKDAGNTWTANKMGFQSCASCGAYSFVILPDNKTIVAVGGDYTRPDEKIGTCRISNDGGNTWHAPTKKLNGYRSNIIHHKKVLYACGSNGIDISKDYGESWTPLTFGNYFTMTVFQKQLVASTVDGTLHFFNLVSRKK